MPSLARSEDRPAQAEPARTEEEPGVWRLGTGVNYSEGDYGDPQKTTVVSAPVSLKYRKVGFSIRVSVPYVSIDGPGSLLDTPQGRDAGFGDGGGFDDRGGSRDDAGSDDNSGSSGSNSGSGSSGSGSGSSGSGSNSGSGGSGGSASGSASACSEQLRRSARDLGGTGFDEVYGYGLID